jgi:hypothetical protein
MQECEILAVLPDSRDFRLSLDFFSTIAIKITKEQIGFGQLE